MLKEAYQIPRVKVLRIDFSSPIADSPGGDITEDPAWEPAMAPEHDFEEEENPWERSAWEEYEE